MIFRNPGFTFFLWFANFVGKSRKAMKNIAFKHWKKQDALQKKDPWTIMKNQNRKKLLEKRTVKDGMKYGIMVEQ